MGFSINTNIASLQAQDYLRVSSDFQGKTINRVTSGLRIVASGDDAAGLAIANGYRSDRAVLTQGVRNANDGMSTLQTIDGGINNISQLLDRARTLAAQSASGTFNGDRSVLNSEFTSVITEIDRQAQAIGLDTGGTFAKSLAVFIGGGRQHGSTTAIDNGSVSVDLTNSIVDAKSLGLKGFQAMGVTATDIGTGSASTSVEDIVNNTTNKNSLAVSGYTDLFVSGAGFSGSDKIKLSVNLAGVTDTDTLVAAINNAITTAGNGTTAAATAFKNASVKASVYTDTSGRKQLAFASSAAAFQVRAGDRMSNALMGNYTSSSDATGKALAVTTYGGADVTAANTWTDSTTIYFRFQGGGLASAVDLSVSVTGAATTVTQVVADLQSQVATNSTLAAAGITVTGIADPDGGGAAGNRVIFTNSKGDAFEVLVAGDNEGELGYGSWVDGATSASRIEYTSVSGTAAEDFDGNENIKLEFMIGGTVTEATIDMDAADTVTTATNKINQAIAASAALKAAGLKASNDGTHLTIASENSTYFRLNSSGHAATNFGWLSAAGVGADYSAITSSKLAYDATFNSGGAANTALGSNDDVFTWAQISGGGDDQAITFTAVDSSGTEHSTSIVLKKDDLTTTAGSSGRTLDEAINYINAQLQQTNDATLQKIVAVKELNYAANAEGVRFLSSLTSFKASVGTNSSTTGISDGTGGTAQGVTISSETSSGGSVADISSQSNAQSAVTLLATAVTTLGSAQAVVGKGQNQFNYAVNLASTQLSNLAAAESRIRDADLASEAANLTKAQIMLQAGIAAMAQANVAPQAVLTLLRG